MSSKPFLNDAIIGDGGLLAAFSRTGRLLRLWWPHNDGPQHIGQARIGMVRLDDAAAASHLTWIDDLPWSHRQRYVDDTNVLETESRHPEWPLRIIETTFAVPATVTVSSDGGLLVRMLTLVNTGGEPLFLRVVHCASFTVEDHPYFQACYVTEEGNAVVHYRRPYAFAVGSSLPTSGFQAGHAFEDATDGRLSGDDIAMHPEAALSWDVTVPPGRHVTLPIFIAAGNAPEDAIVHLKHALNMPVERWLEETLQYWKKALAQAAPLSTTDPLIQRLYRRSILVFHLMADRKTGSIIAAPEFDEAFTHSGGYAYCWGRDAAYITVAFDQAGLTDLTEAFYRWSARAQSPDGSWQQRHYHDGFLAPSWGLQIDESGSILWGLWRHYQTTGNRALLKELWPTVFKGAEFLFAFRDNETALPLPSRDLWEERHGVHAYSAAAVFGGLSGAAHIAAVLGHTLYAERWQKAADDVRRGVLKRLWNVESGLFYRATHLRVDRETYEQAHALDKRIVQAWKGYARYELAFDPVLDVSLLGLSVPFALLPPDDERMRRTAEAVAKRLTVPGVGGLRRYEGDRYAGGNPWILTTLWLALYDVAVGNRARASELLQWGVEHRTALDLLPEQVDRVSGKPAWVIPLTWSHAMFVLLVKAMEDKGWI